MKLRGPTLLTILATLALGACGGDDPETDELQAGDRPVATESLEDFTQVFEDAAASAAEGDCEDWFILFTAELTLSCKEVEKLMNEDPFTVEGTEQFSPEGEDEPGPAAILETTAEQEGEAAWALGADYDGNWRIIGQYVPAPGDELLEEAETSDVAETFIGAIRDNDCKAYMDTVVLAPQDTKEVVCASIEEGPLAEAIQGTETEPEFLGGNEFIHFYGLSLEDEGWFNLVLLDQRGEPKILNNYWVLHPDSPSAVEQAEEAPDAGQDSN